LHLYVIYKLYDYALQKYKLQLRCAQVKCNKHRSALFGAVERTCWGRDVCLGCWSGRHCQGVFVVARGRIFCARIIMLHHKTEGDIQKTCNQSVCLSACSLLHAPSSIRNSSGDKIANVNFSRHLQPLLRSAPRTAEAIEFGEITQNKGHYAVQGHLRSPILVQPKAHVRLPICD